MDVKKCRGDNAPVEEGEVIPIPRVIAMAMAVVLVLLVAGSVLFHFLSPWYFTPIASNWGMIDDTVSITFWVTGIVFVAVNLFVAYAVLRFRHRKGMRAAYEPENKKLEAWLVGVTAVGIAAMLAPGLLVWGKIVEVPKDSAVVEAVGRQWHWSYRFPGKDGVLGTVDARRIDGANPFGMNPDDPHGQDDVLVSSPELHLPLGKPVKAQLRSIDVLHNFAVPQFRVKMDLVPGMVTYMWFTPTRPGKFDLLCEELCGVAHYTMRGRVVVEPDREFEAWLARFPTYAQTIATRPADTGAGKAAFALCAGCHGAEGEGNQALHSPKLAGQADWYLQRQLRNFKEGARGAHEKDVYGKQMAPMAATLPDDLAIANVVAYIATLPDKPSVPTVRPNGSRGKALYDANCAVCHGADGRGRQAMNAPRLAGVSDWYLATQLRNFRQGIRGAHGADPYGPQMASIAASLAEDPAVDAVVAHIASLR